MKKRDYFYAILNILFNICYIPLMCINIFSKTRNNMEQVSVKYTSSIYNVYKNIQADYTINVAIIIFSISIAIGLITVLLRTKEIAKLNFKFLIATFLLFITLLVIFICQFYLLH